MQFPLFKLRPSERSAIYAILERYPDVMDAKYGFKGKVFGFPVSISASVRGVVRDLIGANL